MSWRAASRSERPLNEAWQNAVQGCLEGRGTLETQLLAIQPALDALLRLPFQAGALDAERAARDVSRLMLWLRAAEHTHAPSTSATDQLPLWETCTILLCRLIRDLLHAKLLAPAKQDITLLAQALLRLACPHAVDGFPYCAPQTQHECLRALSALHDELPAAIEPQAAAALHSALLATLEADHTGAAPPRAVPELEKALVDALNRLVARRSAALPTPWLRSCLAACARRLHALAAVASTTMVDEWHSSHYAALLRLVTALVPLTGSAFAAHDAVLVDSVMRFVTWTAPPPDRGAPPPAGGSPGAYVPPSRRHPRSGHGSSSCNASDSEAPAQRHASQVRLDALLCLGTMLRENAAALHPIWDRLLPPAHGALGFREDGGRRVTLLSLLLRDGSARVRLQAAQALVSMFEDRRARAFMAVAQFDPARRAHTGAFTPLSVALGDLLAGTHAGLAAALAGERNDGVASMTLRAATALAHNAPYRRLSGDMLVALLEAALTRWQLAQADRAQPAAQAPQTPRSWGSRDPSQASGSSVTVLCAVLSLLTAGLGSAASLSIPPYRATPAPRNGAAAQAPRLRDVVPLLLGAAEHESAAVRWEAFAALRAACQQRFPCVAGAWPAILDSAREHACSGGRFVSCATQQEAGGAPRQSESGRAATASMPEKAANQALRLAGDHLRQAFLASQRSGSAAEAAHPSGLAGPLIGESATRERGSNGSAETVSLAQVLDRAEALLSGELTEALASQLPLVRGAAFATIADLPSDLLASLPPERLTATLSTASRAATSDPVPAVRSNAVKLLRTALEHAAVVLAFPAATAAAAAALEAASRDGAAAVRLAASAAVAALAAQLRAMTGQVEADDEADPQTSALGANAPVHRPSGVPTPLLVGAAEQGPVEGEAAARAVPIAQALTPAAWRSVAAAALAASRDSDKPRAHGMRAVACVVSLLPLSDTLMQPECAAHVRGDLRAEPSVLLPALEGLRLGGGPAIDVRPRHSASEDVAPDRQAESRAAGCADADSRLEAASPDRSAAEDLDAAWLPWLESAAAAIRSCLDEAKSKATWNACVAASRVLANRAILQHRSVRGRVVPALVPPLLDLLQLSANYKVRIHAASALMEAYASGALGPGDAECLRALDTMTAALRTLESPVDASDAQTDAADAQPGDEAAFPNFRYHAALSSQLKRGIAALSRHVRPHNVACVQHHAPFLVALLLDEVATAQEAGLVAARARLPQVPPEALGDASALGVDDLVTGGVDVDELTREHASAVLTALVALRASLVESGVETLAATIDDFFERAPRAPMADD